MESMPMSDKNVVIVAFRGDPICFVHVLLNALDMSQKGMNARIILEGESTRLIPEIATPGHPLHDLYGKAKAGFLFAAVCRACATKMGTVAAVEKEGLPLVGDMSGHPALAGYIEEGYTVITL